MEPGKSRPTNLRQILRQLDELESLLSPQLQHLDTQAKPPHVGVHQAEWYVRGLAYHCRNLLQHYESVSRELAVRMAATEADIWIMYAPDIQKLFFEFHALVTLARIGLDGLRTVLAPVFKTRYGALPKSIRAYAAGSTDCPLYQAMSVQPAIAPTVAYLCDLRDCIVHYRPFVAHDNIIAVREGPSQPEAASALETLPESLARATYRRHRKGVVPNIYLPDAIFGKDAAGTKRLAVFGYETKRNILSASRDFTGLVAYVMSAALKLLIDPGVPTYSYMGKKGV